MWDVAIDYQKLRHGSAARLLRAAVFRVVAGPDSWPVAFRRPDPGFTGPRGTSHHLYVHLPFCRRICSYCPYNKVLLDPDLAARYGEALDREVADYLHGGRVPAVRSLYFGGGTPSATPDLVLRVIERVGPALEPAAEVGVEVHPADAHPPLLERLRAAGVTRVSLGVETLRDDLLRGLGRPYSASGALRALEAALAAGFECVDANLIYGIPGQATREPAADAARCASLGVDQVSAYPLISFVHTPLGRRVAGGRAPIYGDRGRLAAQRAISRTLVRSGLSRTSVWSFTRRGVRPYSTVTHEDYVGFGAGAASKVSGAFSFNTFSVEAYAGLDRHRPALVMEAGDRLRRLHWLYWQIYRTEIDPDGYRAHFGRGLARDFGPLLALMRLLGWTRRDGGRIRLTERGAIWAHRLQALYSLTYIDDLWRRCRGEPWPAEVVLE